MKNKELITAKTEEFSRAILDCGEYKEFIKNSENLNKDATVQNLLKRFQEKQIKLVSGDFSPALLDDLKRMQTEINQNRTIQDYEKSQDELVGLLKRTNNVISMRIGMQFALSASGGGGCCG